MVGSDMAYSINDANIAWFFTWTGAEKIQLYVTKMFKYDVNTAQVNRNGKRKMEKKIRYIFVSEQKEYQNWLCTICFHSGFTQIPIDFFFGKILLTKI